MATHSRACVLVPCRRCTPALHVHQWAVLREQRALALRLQMPAITAGIPFASAADTATSAAHLLHVFGSVVEHDVETGVSHLVAHPTAFDVATAPVPLHVEPRNNLPVHQLADRVVQALKLCQAVCAAFPVLEVPAVRPQV